MLTEKNSAEIFEILSAKKLFVFDMDGTIYLGGIPFDFAVRFINKLRERIHNITIRTTFIVGFPGETDENFESLSEFADEMKFDRYGCFAYSAEEDTPAATMENQIDEDVKIERASIMNSQQQRIFEDKLEALVGKELTVIVDGFDEEEMLYFGRSYMDAPEIDSGINFVSEKELGIGEAVDVLITSTDEYDLIGTADF